ncbi:MAG: GLPGLI family protein [Gemmatimonadales bacterium]
MTFRLVQLTALLVGLPALAIAQSGTVRYNETTALDFKIPPNSPMAGRFPKSMTKPMQLTFTPEAALFAEAPRTEGNPNGETRVVTGGTNAVFIGGGGGQQMEVRRDGEMAMGGGPMFMFGGGGPGQGTVAGAFTNLSDGSYIEMREFLGKSFRIPDSRPTFSWKLTGEQATFLGHPVLQAKATRDSTTLEAWFTPDIPVSAGPAQYGGLPGLILTLTVDSNKVIYTATAIDLTTAVAPIKIPSQGSKVTRAEFDKIVKEKMDEMAKGRRGRGN